jgi:hypothetical protein
MLLPTMTKHLRVYFLAIAAIAASPAAFAGAGQTSAGVTTTTGTIDPTAATQNVQSQSSNFVQENQNQAAQMGGPISTVPGTAMSKTGASSTAQGSDPSSAAGKPGDPNNPNGDPKAAGAQASAPAVPAAPPPDYVSNVKKVTRDSATTGVVIADNAPMDGTKSPASPAPAATDSTATPNVIGAPGMQRQAAAATPRVPRAADGAKASGAERVSQQTAVGGGSGSAPDSYAFYIGIIIAGALLAFAAATFFRSDKGAK